MRQGPGKSSLKRLQSKVRRSSISKPSLHPRTTSRKTTPNSTLNQTNESTFSTKQDSTKELPSGCIVEQLVTTLQETASSRKCNLQSRTFKRFMQQHPLMRPGTYKRSFIGQLQSSTFPMVSSQIIPYVLNLPFVNVLTYIFSGFHRQIVALFQKTLRGKIDTNKQQQGPHQHHQSPHIEQPLTYQGLKEHVLKRQQLIQDAIHFPQISPTVPNIIDGSTFTKEMIGTLDGLLQHHPLNLALQRQYHSLFGTAALVLTMGTRMGSTMTAMSSKKISNAFIQSQKFNQSSVHQLLSHVKSFQRNQFSASARGRQILQGYAAFNSILPASNLDQNQQQQHVKDELQHLQHLIQLNPSFEQTIAQQHANQLLTLLPQQQQQQKQQKQFGPSFIVPTNKVPNKITKNSTHRTSSFFQLKDHIVRFTMDLKNQFTDAGLGANATNSASPYHNLPIDVIKTRQYLRSLHKQRKLHKSMFKQLNKLQPIRPNSPIMAFITSHKLHAFQGNLSTHPIFASIFNRHSINKAKMLLKSSTRAYNTQSALRSQLSSSKSNSSRLNSKHSISTSQSAKLNTSAKQTNNPNYSTILQNFYPKQPYSNFKRNISSISSISTQKRELHQIHELNQQARRQFGILNTPRTERLSSHHFSTFTEMTPFRLHVNDALRAVTKFAYMNTSALKPLKLSKIRPVIMPFWGFQGQLVITHKSSKTSKVIDYVDVERNTDVAQYCQLLNVREDELYYGMAPIRLTNPNIDLGQDFMHEAQDMNGRRAELYSTQPNSINTLRMRAQQLCSGSEWAPWITESLKTHIQMSQTHNDNLLQFPEDSIYPDDFADYKEKLHENATQAPRATDEDNQQLEKDEQVNYTKNLAIEKAKRARAEVNPLDQTYKQTVQLERHYRNIAPSIKAIPRKQTGVALETDEHIRSERASLIESLVNMTMLEFNLIQRGVGMTINQTQTPHNKHNKIGQHDNLSTDHDPDNPHRFTDLKHSAEFEDPKTLHGAFLTSREQKDMLLDFAKIHHQIIGDSSSISSTLDTNTSNSDTISESNPLGVKQYSKTNCPFKKFNRHFAAPTKDPIDFLQQQLLDDKLSLQTGVDPSNSSKFAQAPQQKALRQKLRQEILHQFLHNKVKTDAGNKSVKFDIPGTDYEITFNGVTSRKLMYPGYINEYNYLQQKWHIMTSAVTGVSAGIQHRHYTAVATNALKKAIGAGFAGVGLRFALKRLALPPLYTAVATIVLIIYSLREVVSGHFAFQQSQSEYSKMLSNEFQNEQKLYSTLNRSNMNVAPGADEIRESWEFHPYTGFYTMNNMKAQHMWECLSRKDEPQRSQQRAKRQAQQKDEQKKDKARERFEQQRAEAERQKRMRDMPTPLPTDPYVLIFGESHFGVKSGQNPSLSQVSKLTFQEVKTQYMKELKKWHPDFYNADESIYSPEYVEERTRDIIEAFTKINTDSKKSSFDRDRYR